MDKLVIRGTEINVQWDLKRDDFLSLTDIAKIKDKQVCSDNNCTCTREEIHSASL